MRRRYHVLDVFTDTKLAGTPLAVVLDGEGLDDAAMQAIAREFNRRNAGATRHTPPRWRASSASPRPTSALPAIGRPGSAQASG